MRSGIWGEVASITGIEAVGTIVADPGGRFARGARVVTLMGGLGRTRPGSYAELIVADVNNVVPVDTSLSWIDLAAVPEVYAAAWSGLNVLRALEPGATVLVRGATAALGQAAVNIAVDAGAHVIATTRTATRGPLLRGLGAELVLIDDGNLAGQVAGQDLTVDALLDLVGNSVVRDSLAVVRPDGGRVCQMGFLGGQEPIDGFNPLTDLPRRSNRLGWRDPGRAGTRCARIPYALLTRILQRGPR